MEYYQSLLATDADYAIRNSASNHDAVIQQSQPNFQQFSIEWSFYAETLPDDTRFWGAGTNQLVTRWFGGKMQISHSEGAWYNLSEHVFQPQTWYTVRLHIDRSIQKAWLVLNGLVGPQVAYTFAGTYSTAWYFSGKTGTYMGLGFQGLYNDIVFFEESGTAPIAVRYWDFNNCSNSGDYFCRCRLTNIEIRIRLGAAPELLPE